jgi:hypothetical protein
MKKIIILTAALFLFMGFVLAADQAAPSASAKAMTYAGTIIDNQCANSNKANLGEFIKTHTKSCALMPNCIASGYSLYLPDGTLKPFDKVSNAKIEKFLKKKSSKLAVDITAKESSGQLTLVSIKNQPVMKESAK